ncbi:hypothetical protein [Candidatus Frankia alpina]|uniref:Uncharacterized protein n=1 Tax=Candidatus Frankia alpina TaxID=2699483 RepID=A0A4V6S8B5_9ACTN|nr:hypothetical protein [Candidatus Frankia alpina]THJ71579.1 hypothetical protein E7Y31_15255 [Candidatus Frankia alpina]
MTGVRADLRSVPWLLAVLLVGLASVVLALRVAGLAVLVIVDAAERIEVAASTAVGIAPLAASVVVLPSEGSR